MKTAITLLSTCLFLLAAEINLHIEGIVDNREYMGKYDEPGTIFGLMEHGTASFSKDSTHTFTAGVSWFQEFGSDIENWPATPLVYYKYQSDKSRFLFGSFIRKDNIFYSPVFMDERYSYKRPQAEGIDYRYSYPLGFQTIWVDWDSRQSKKDYERFFVGISGITRIKKFSLEHHFLYRHLAGRDIVPHDPVGENGGAHIIFAFEENEISRMDTLKLTAEMIGSYNRLARSDDWNAPLGFAASAAAVFPRLGIRARFYKGVKKSISWHQLEQGAPFYDSPQFGDIDLMLFPVKKDNIEMKFKWTISFVNDDIENRQHFLLIGDFGHKFMKRGDSE